jgi:2-oxoisovalerate dehydrogenase E2 component (dihydrolipoyl transacylase)
MATVAMPHLGESVSEGTIGRWLKRPGEHVEQYEPLVEVTTDKVNTEMPAPVGGVLREITAQEGETVRVGAQIAIIAAEGEAEVEALAPEPVTNQDGGEAAGPMHPVEDAPVVASAEPAESAEAWTPAASAPITSLVDETGERRRFTPVVLRLAEQHGIALEQLARVAGSGLGGRVSKADILRHIESQGLAPVAAAGGGAAAAVSAPAPTPLPVQPRPQPVAPPAPRPAQVAAAPAPMQGAGDGDFLPLTPMRKAIAEHMVRSLATAPHAWTMVEIDMTALVRYRAAKKDAFERREGFGLSYVPFFIRAVVGALKEFPVLNATFAEGGIQLKRAINVGVAVALPEGQGLLVPVIKGADGHNLVGLARAVNDLALRARAGKLTADDLAGGTFTVNNTGAFGSILSKPIINQPQAAIVTMEAIVKRPVVITDPATEQDVVAIRSLMNCCLSLDHRVLDGLTGGQFLASIKRRLETFAGVPEL